MGKKVLFAWEGGANLGHVDRMAGVARHLRKAGHEPVFALRDLTRSHARLVKEGFQVLQAPVWVPRPGAGAPRMLSYASILASVGWQDAESLAGLISGWRELFKLLSPDLLLADHSPTAMLAWRGRGKPLATLGSSFELPPPGDHFPAFRWWEKEDRSAIAPIEVFVLDVANQALGLLGQPVLNGLGEVLAADVHFLLGIPELAHYQGYPAQMPFFGPSHRGDHGAEPVWPMGAGPKVFVYLEPGHKDFSALLETLRKLEWPILVYAHGVDESLLNRLQSHALAFSSEPLKMDAVLASADLVVSHASLGTTTAALLAGKPQLVLPNHIEQYMVARRLQTLGAGLYSVPAEQRIDYKKSLQKLVSDTSFREAAATVAARYSDASPAQTDARVAEACLSLLADQ